MSSVQPHGQPHDTVGTVDTRPGPEARPGPSDVAPPAPVPRRSPQVGWVGLILAVAVTGLGLLALYEAFVLLGWLSGSSVITPFLENGIRLEPDGASAVLGALLLLGGLWLLWTALKPGRRKGVRLATHTGVWTTRSDLERLAAGTARDVDGVLDAQAQVRGRRARLVVDATHPSVRDHVRRAVEERLSVLDAAPRVDVRSRSRHTEAS